MILYHGSYRPIERPDLSFSRRLLDFGAGFYATPIREQAANWARHFIEERGSAYLSAYTFLERADEDISAFRVLEFDRHSKKWLDFITANRLGKESGAEWDLVIGGVANDKVFNTLELYFKGERTAAEAIRRLRYNKPNYQYCFRNQSLIDGYLKFMNAEEVK